MLDKDAHEGVSRPGRTALQQVIPWEVLAAAECGKNKSMKCLQFLKEKGKNIGNVHVPSPGQNRQVAWVCYTHSGQCDPAPGEQGAGGLCRCQGPHCRREWV